MADRQFGGFWRRLLAYTVDKIILYFISVILFLIGLLAMGLGGVSLAGFAMTGDLPRGMGLFVTVYLITALFMNMMYFIWFHGTVGQTLGKRLCGLRLIRISSEKMTLGIAFLRWVGSLISGIFFCLGFIWIAIDGRKQGWHDKIAGTLVVHTVNELVAEVPLRALNIQPPTEPEPPPSTQRPVLISPVAADNLAEPSRSADILLPETGPSGRSTENPRDDDSNPKPL